MPSSSTPRYCSKYRALIASTVGLYKPSCCTRCGRGSRGSQGRHSGPRGCRHVRRLAPRFPRAGGMREVRGRLAEDNVVEGKRSQTARWKKGNSSKRPAWSMNGPHELTELALSHPEWQGNYRVHLLHFVETRIDLESESYYYLLSYIATRSKLCDFLTIPTESARPKGAKRNHES